MYENLVEWNPWWIKKEFDTGIKREQTDKLIEYLKLRHIKIISGIRRSGKTTVLHQIIRHLIENGTNPKSILFINMEDESLGSFEDIMHVYLENHNQEKIYLFIDEVQAKPHWEFWVKTAYEQKKFKQIFITGSPLRLKESKEASLLTGRSIELVLSPLSFKEYLRFKDVDCHNREKRVIAKITKELKEYIKFGGFPEVVLTEQKHILLVEYFDNIVEKDIVARLGLDYFKVKDLTRYLVSNPAKLHSYKKLSSVVNLSPTSIAAYLNHFENSYLFSQMYAFSSKIKDQLKHPRKIYCVDTGFINTSAFRTSADSDRLYENVVFNHLDDAFYWKSMNREVDFIIQDKKQLIQVCSNIRDYDTKKRETKALLHAAKELRYNNLLIITDDYKGKEDNIGFIPLWKWLLEQK